MKVLVTGGAGFIGTHLVERLLHDDNDVVVLDNMSTGKIDGLLAWKDDKRLRLITGDVRDEATVRDSIESVDVVVHLAAISSIPYSISNPSDVMDVNVKGTLNLLRSAAERHVQRFVLASSSAVYGKPMELPITEEHPVEALSPYAASKIASEQLCHTFRELYGLHSVCLRFFNVYGSGQVARDSAGVVAQFISRIKSGRRIEIFGDGEQTRDFINVRDAVSAIMLAIANGVEEKTFNVGSGREVTINDLGRTILRICGKSEQGLLHKPAISGEARHSCASITRSFEFLGFVPRVELEDGLRHLINEANGSSALAEELS